MGRDPTAITTDREALRRFARALQMQFGAARVLLFGSRARGNERGDSDYDLIVVSPRFADIPPLDRGRGLRELWVAVGGYGPMDLICMTPESFETARRRISLVAEVLPEAIDLWAAEGAGTASL
jgi:predicted nucleotidyltransferase